MLGKVLIASRFDIPFDIGKLKIELASIPASAWTPHFNKACYCGEWSAVPLLAPKGESHPIRQICSNPGVSAYVETLLLKRCPWFLQLLSQFNCELLSTRLLKLGAGSRILRHRDHELSLEEGVARIHIPLVSDTDVRLRLDDRAYNCLPGEVWYMNFSLPHEFENNSHVDRVHLVVDCVVNAWLVDTVMAGELYFADLESQQKEEMIG